jgi:hypothetical protein
VCRNKEGNRYLRSLPVETELRGIIQRDPAEWIGQAKELQTETLFCLIHLMHEVDQNVCGQLIEVLQGRVARRFRKRCEQLEIELDDYDMEQILSEINMQVLELALTKEPSRDREFMEVRFGLKLKRLIDKQLEKFGNSTAGNIADLAIDEMDTNGAEEDAARPVARYPVADSPEDTLLNLDSKNSRHRLLLKALHAVPDARHRKAVILHYAKGIPIASSRRGQKCLTRIFRKEERQIKYWISIAMKQMREALGVQLPQSLVP